MNMNPLLDFSGLPRFDTLRAEHVAPAIDSLIAENRALITQLTQSADEPTWDNFAAPLTDAGERLSRAWGMVGHMHGVMDVPEWREAYNQSLPAITAYYTDLGQNLELFRKFKAIRAGAGFAALSAAQQRVIDNDIRDFRLSGAELADEAKPRFKEIQEELAQLGAKFSENLLDATNAYAEWVEDESLLSGIPADALHAARAAAERENRAGWKFTLHMPSYLPLMQYADNRELRARMYRANATRASEFSAETGHAEWDNGPLIRRILELRAEESRMLGYASFAELSLVPKMAESPRQVLDFLADLARRARPYAERDLAELREFAARELNLPQLESWDVPYASEKLKQARYSFSDEEVKQYLPQPKVLAGLFRVVEALYGVTLREDNAPTWHEDVRFYSIERAGELVGQFYIDLYARETKRGGAWMDEARSRRQCVGGVQKPIAYLTCNFSAPVGGKPACFTHDEVLTLFHECGHGLHHLLTRVDELAVAGIHGVEWDAVELPSQFMENFCWEWDVLSAMSGHVESGEALPRALFERMLAAKNFQSGLQTLRQIEFAVFDMRLHDDFDAQGAQSCLDLLAEVRREVAVLVPPAWNRFPNSFSHIFAGGYAAGYYSYKWAEVLSADAFEAFEEAARASTPYSVLDRGTGMRFLDEILAMGGARPALQSFKAFRGREPRVDALLRHSGMVEA
ncbi:MAG: M3 family metallopeptidase [Rhodocyclaceae bacterium]|nr:M3 family metallopeptidase [Rhodocyclaceae bacterium]MBX3667123.1 M3 family metallopeptidase [Rhodocyclaceae bacterium]